MKIYLVWTEDGEYEQYSRDLRGVFQTREMADAHAAQIKGEAEEWDVLVELPHKVTHYEWSDRVTPDGAVSPDDERPLKIGDGSVGKKFGHRRESWSSWSNEEVAVKGDTKDERGTMWVSVEGSDHDAVRQTYLELLAEAKQTQAQRRGMSLVALETRTQA